MTVADDTEGQGRLRRLIPASRGARATLTIAVIVNVVLLTAYLWSRGGQTTHVHLEARGDRFEAWLDGHQRASVVANAPVGGPVVSLLQSQDVRAPSLPRPRGVQHVIVTDLSDGERLFEWRRGDPPPPGSIVSIDLADRDWTDYAVDIYYRNAVSGGAEMRAGSKPGYLFGFAPIGNDSFYFSTYPDQDGNIQNAGGRAVSFSETQGVRALVAIALQSYPLALAFILVLFAAVAAAALVPMKRRATVSILRSPYIPPIVVAGLVVFALLATSAIHARYSQRMPHVVDETSYIFQAKLLASGRAHTAPPPIPEAFEFWNQDFIIDYDGRFASFYPFGQPLVLAVGVRVGLMWFIPALVGAGCVALLYVLGRNLYGTYVGLLAALLLATSPFFLMQASTYMSHNTAALYLLGSLTALTILHRRPELAGLLAGLAFGLFFNTRPFSAVALAPFMVLLLVAPLLAQGQTKRSVILRCGGFVLGGLIMLGAYYAYNLATTGTLSNGYEASGNPGGTVGFGGSVHSLSEGIQNHKLQLASLALVLHGWPTYVGFMFILLPFVLGTRRLMDWWLLAASVFVIAAWILYESNGLAYGPRYWYEIVPLLLLLAARGAVLVAGSSIAILRSVFAGYSRRWPPSPLVAHVFVSCVVLALVGSSLYSWLLGQRPSWHLFGTPSRPAEMRFAMDDRLIRAVRDADVGRALVLVAPCGESHLCYQSVFWLNNPDLDGRVVYANDLGPRNQELFALYPCRNLYFASYAPLSIRAAGQTPPPSGGSCEN